MKPTTIQTRNILQKIQELCSDIVGVEPYDVTPGTYLLEDLGLNAGDMQTLFGELEEEFQCMLDNDLIEQAVNDDITVLELIEMVESKT